LFLKVYSRLTLLARVQVPFLYICALQIHVLIWHWSRRDVIITYTGNQTLQIYSRGLEESLICTTCMPPSFEGYSERILNLHVLRALDRYGTKRWRGKGRIIACSIQTT
jgi:hypothetical protein